MPLVDAAWPTRMREHVDLWLHAYAVLTPDTTLVPYFRRGYVERVAGVRRQRNVTTLMGNVLFSAKNMGFRPYASAGLEVDMMNVFQLLEPQQRVVFGLEAGHLYTGGLGFGRMGELDVNGLFLSAQVAARF